MNNAICTVINSSKLLEVDTKHPPEAIFDALQKLPNQHHQSKSIDRQDVRSSDIPIENVAGAVAKAVHLSGSGIDVEADASPDPMTPFSLNGKSAELSAQLLAQKPALGQIALTGQATVIYAPSNTGKTLITLYLLIDSISKGFIDPAKVYYLNMDDTAIGLVEKLKIAEDSGFNMVADGQLGFSAKGFMRIMDEMVGTTQPNGMVIVLDTVKKFADLMSKQEAAALTAKVRRFVQAGGTLIGLAHTNKNRVNGKLVHAGTSDLIDDFDCAYIVDDVPTTSIGVKTVKFTNHKRRGNVPASMAFTYSTTQDLSYQQLLNSVKELDEEDLWTGGLQAAEVADSVVIEAIKGCIQEGVVKKIRLAEEAGKRAGVGRNSVITVLDRYSGRDAQHHWNFAVVARGAKSYSLNRLTMPVPQDASLPAPQDSTMPAPLEASMPVPQDASIPSVASPNQPARAVAELDCLDELALEL